MPEVKAFKGYRFAEEKVGSYDEVVTPPFDVISPAERAELAARSPYNVAHLILPEAEGDLDKYHTAARKFEQWIADGVERRDDEESFYLLEQEFSDYDRNRHLRRAFFAVAKIPEAGERAVLGHEKTFRHKIEDRLALMRATRSNMGGIFVMYPDPEKQLGGFLNQMEARPPDLTATTIDGVTQRLWRVPADPAVTEFFRERPIYIADGHHRFATATAYRDEMRAKEGGDGCRPWDYVLMGFVAFDDPGLLVYPAHRVLDLPQGMAFEAVREKLEPFFSVTEVDNDLAHKVDTRNGCTLGMAVGGAGQFLLKLHQEVDREAFLGTDHGPSWRSLDAAVLHRGIIENILGVEAGSELIYEPDPQKAVAYCERGEKGLAFIMNGATAEQIRACADSGEFMPQKTTYLYPKLPTGAVFYRFD